MDRVKELIVHIKEHKGIAKAVAAVLIITVAFMFFGDNGEKEIINVESSDAADYNGKDSIPQSVTEEIEDIYVDISGQIKSPGVYTVKEGSRLFEVIELAGGVTEEADINGFNRAEVVSDGEKILIPAKGEAAYSDSLVNINNSDSSRLQTVPGIGPATAERIIQYREESGRFKNKEDIKSVNGIGEKTYEKIESYITV